MLESFSSNLFTMYTDIRWLTINFLKNKDYENNFEPYPQVFQIKCQCSSVAVIISAHYKTTPAALKLAGWKKKTPKSKTFFHTQWIFNMPQLLIRQWKLKLQILAERWNRERIQWWWEPKVQKFKIGFPGGAVVGNLPASAGDTGSSPGLGGSHMPRSNWAREPQLLSLRVWSLCSATREARAPRRRVAPACRNWREPSHRNEDPTQPKKKKKKKMLENSWSPHLERWDAILILKHELLSGMSTSTSPANNHIHKPKDSLCRRVMGNALLNSNTHTLLTAIPSKQKTV